MFEQFRSYFPQGCLISELVQIDHGKYIVRASVQNEGLTLATGLAAADTVEKAEDQARNRALAVLDISLTPAQSNRYWANSQPKESAAQPTTANSASSHSTTSTNSQNKEQSKSSSVPGTSATPNAFPSPVNAEPDIALSQMETEATKQQTSSPAAEASSSEQMQSQSLGESPQPSSVSSSSSEDETSDETTMDYSDIIAKTNVELKRLRWTNEQGRKFLEETYGKRSRSLLSESELLEFLQYLEKQPTPLQPS